MRTRTAYTIRNRVTSIFESTFDYGLDIIDQLHKRVFKDECPSPKSGIKWLKKEKKEVVAHRFFYGDPCAVTFHQVREVSIFTSVSKNSNRY